MEAKFILSRKKLHEQYNFFRNLNFGVSYSFKTNPLVAKILFKETDCDFSIHTLDDFKYVPDGKRIWYFSQAWNKNDLKKIFARGIRKFVVDSEVDLKELLNFLNKNNFGINLALRMKFRENRIQTGKYFVYGMSSARVCEAIKSVRGNKNIAKLGIHIHRKSQNASEWEIKNELQDALPEDALKMIDFVNLGGGYPVKYRNYVSPVLGYIKEKLVEVRDWLVARGIEVIAEPGRFIAAPCINLVAEIIQIYDDNIVLNCSLYNSQLDTLLTDIRLLVKGEINGSEKKGREYIIKGNTPARDDIFRYKARLNEKKVGDKIVFLNAGAYNYSTDFCGLKRLKTEIVD
jgi:ornithine decarboxylase